MRKVSKFVFWTPRIVLIAFALFLVIFSFDVFDGASSAGEIAIGLFMHNLPSLVLLGILWLSWKRELVGGIIFTAFGVACVIMTIVALSMSSTISSSKLINPIWMIGSVVFLLVGVLFLIGWSKKRK